VIRSKGLVSGSAVRIISVNLMLFSKMVINICYVINNSYIPFSFLSIILIKLLYFYYIRLINIFNLKAVFPKLTFSYTYPYYKDYGILAIFEIIRYNRLILKGKTYSI